jgi:hypothetical protein
MASRNGSLRATAAPSGFLSRIAAFAFALKRELAGLAGLVLVAAVAMAVYGAARGEPEAPPFQAAPVPLSIEGIQSWAEATSALAAARNEGKLELQSRTLPDFLEWMRTHREILLGTVPNLDPEAYLGLTQSIHRARTRERNLYEYEVLAKSEEEAWKRIRDSGVEFRYTPPPTLEQGEWEDLRLYESRWNLVESALFSLMPSIELPIPAPAEEVKKPGGGGGDKPSAQPIRWRTVNASRHGPRVVRTR